MFSCCRPRHTNLGPLHHDEVGGDDVGGGVVGPGAPPPARQRRARPTDDTEPAAEPEYVKKIGPLGLKSQIYRQHLL